MTWKYLSKQKTVKVVVVVVVLVQSCPTVCDSMDCSMPGFPVLQHLLEFAQIHVHPGGC